MEKSFLLEANFGLDANQSFWPQTVKMPRRFKAIVFPLLLLGLKEI